ncbi:MAG TPA: CDP-alcohol phosphatidyltransferase family protein [bacterium]|nr:CDP-alcohol phosphatidyltransferase family protein [bacterium]HQG44622.1 CDP-alcohol phosphatidyltransferase family protein [bacterium]HQI48703.1 CDP-alcohol phosphatidyltransferase family protein [bacterium]HQJ65042.1 CDP-alcohol phosphatidyltransferase family protein [bacterium]
MKLGLMEIIKKDKHLLGLPNLLSFSRLLFLPLICYAITLEPEHGGWLALLLLGLSFITDFFDGFVARQRQQFSELGRILDPVMDKLNVGLIMIMLACCRDLPWWYVLMVIGRDLVILILSLYVIKRRQHVPQSIFIGKVALVAFLVVIMTYIMNWRPFNYIALAVSVTLIPVTLFCYIIPYVRRSRMPEQF